MPPLRFFAFGVLASLALGLSAWLGRGPLAALEGPLLGLFLNGGVSLPGFEQAQFQSSSTTPTHFSYVATHAAKAEQARVLLVAFTEEDRDLFLEWPPSPLDLATVLAPIRQAGSATIALIDLPDWQGQPATHLRVLLRQLQATPSVFWSARGESLLDPSLSVLQSERLAHTPLPPEQGSQLPGLDRLVQLPSPDVLWEKQPLAILWPDLFDASHPEGLRLPTAVRHRDRACLLTGLAAALSASKLSPQDLHWKESGWQLPGVFLPASADGGLLLDADALSLDRVTASDLASGLADLARPLEDYSLVVAGSDQEADRSLDGPRGRLSLAAAHAHLAQFILREIQSKETLSLARAGLLGNLAPPFLAFLLLWACLPRSQADRWLFTLMAGATYLLVVFVFLGESQTALPLLVPGLSLLTLPFLAPRLRPLRSA
ncbi:MAG: hypothetical protein AAF555_07590 [Verrucomicrobiota bacterium]